MATKNPGSLPTAAVTGGRVSRDTVERAVTALLKWKESQSKDQAPQLLPEDEFLYLNITLKQIPPKARTNPFRIALPYPLHDQASESCLIIDDRPSSNLTSKDAKKIIKSQDVSVSKVLKLSKLKTDYKAFEAKRKLCDSYDLFFVDKRIVHFLPKLLGKQFFKKKKLPLLVDLTKKNWKNQIQRACGSGLFFLSTGTCSVMKVGKRAMNKEEIVDNVVDAINGVVDYVPKGWGGVRSFHLRLAGSVALPLYQTLPDMKLKIMGAKEMEREMDIKGSSEGITEGKETSKPQEAARKKRKGRLHEVRYMDVDIGGSELESDDEDAENETKKNHSDEFDPDENVRKNENLDIHKGNVEEETDKVSEENEGDDDLVPAKLEGKKGRKGKSQKGQILGVLNGEKKSKKVKKGDDIEHKKQKKMKSSTKSEDESVFKKGDDIEDKKQKKIKSSTKSEDESVVKKGDDIEDKKQKKIKSSTKSEDESVVKKGKRKNVLAMKSKEGMVKPKSKRNKKSE